MHYAGQKNLSLELDYNKICDPQWGSKLCTCKNGEVLMPVNEKGIPQCYVIRKIEYQNRELKWLHNPILQIPGFAGFLYTMPYWRSSAYFEISSDFLHDKKALVFIENVFADPCSFIPEIQKKTTVCSSKSKFSGTYEVRFVDKDKSIVHTKYYTITNGKE